MKVDRITHSRDIFIRNFSRWRPVVISDLIKQEIAPFYILRPWKPYSRTKHEVDLMTRCRGIADFSLHMRISAIFPLPAEVIVTDSESHIPVSYSSLIVTMALSGLVFEKWAWDRQTTDEPWTNPLLKVARHLKIATIGPYLLLLLLQLLLLLLQLNVRSYTCLPAILASVCTILYDCRSQMEATACQTVASFCRDRLFSWLAEIRTRSTSSLWVTTRCIASTCIVSH